MLINLIIESLDKNASKNKLKKSNIENLKKYKLYFSDSKLKLKRLKDFDYKNNKQNTKDIKLIDRSSNRIFSSKRIDYQNVKCLLTDNSTSKFYNKQTIITNIEKINYNNSNCKKLYIAYKLNIDSNTTVLANIQNSIKNKENYTYLKMIGMCNYKLPEIEHLTKNKLIKEGLNSSSLLHKIFIYNLNYLKCFHK